MTENEMNLPPELYATETQLKKLDVQLATIQQSEALVSLAMSMEVLAKFVTTGGLQAVLNGYAKTQAVTEMLGGLTAHDGRQALDARTIKQNALEITEAIEAVHRKYSERLQEAALRDPEIHKAAE